MSGRQQLRANLFIRKEAMPSTMTSLASLVIGGVVLVVLFVVLGVTLWVSIVAGGVAALVTILGGGGAAASRRGSHAHPHGI
jgi:hypothetical protein